MFRDEFGRKILNMAGEAPHNNIAGFIRWQRHYLLFCNRKPPPSLPLFEPRSTDKVSNIHVPYLPMRELGCMSVYYHTDFQILGVVLVFAPINTV